MNVASSMARRRPMLSACPAARRTPAAAPDGPDADRPPSAGSVASHGAAGRFCMSRSTAWYTTARVYEDDHPLSCADSTASATVLSPCTARAGKNAGSAPAVCRTTGGFSGYCAGTSIANVAERSKRSVIVPLAWDTRTPPCDRHSRSSSRTCSCRACAGDRLMMSAGGVLGGQ
jgi:hypothetical protein